LTVTRRQRFGWPGLMKAAPEARATASPAPPAAP
jgi:hypothetical protein